LGVAGDVRFHREFYFIEPGGRRSVLRSGFVGRLSFLTLKFLSAQEKVAVARALAALPHEWRTRGDLDGITMLDWLHEKNQPPRAIERFWRQVLVSAVNEELDRMAARHGLQVLWLGFMARPDACEMGVPAVPLGELYRAEAWNRLTQVRISTRAPVEQIRLRDGTASGLVVNGEETRADFVISAVPFERLGALGLEAPVFEHSPITGVHLWFDRQVMDLPHATLLDRTIQWAFDKGGGSYVLVVVSASRGLVEMARNDVIDLAVRELADFFPRVREATLVKAHVVKEIRATFSAAPNLESKRPTTRTAIRNVFLAGDWTRSGWPATMEGAVRSGYLAAEAVTEECGAPRKFLLADIA
jgi:zeta-carotene desaturase